jgi:anthranilate phosphoribosyltransferase
MIIKDAIAKLADRADLSEKEAEEAMLAVMEGQATSAQIAAYLMGLRVKGETVEEIVGSARAMRAKALRIRVADPLVVDTCGTGGDRTSTFNISTTAAFVVAGGGLTVAKHGNRSVSSKSGSADVLVALGVNIELPVEQVEDCINEIGVGFLFAPLFHKAMQYCAAPRQEMGIRTLLNILGPLANPAGASIQVLGVYDSQLTELLAKVLVRLGTQHCFVVHGMDGLDELTLTDRTRVSEGKAGVVTSYFLKPEDVGLPRARMKDLIGGTPEENAQITREILRGRRGPKRDVVCLNAAPAFVAAGKVKTLAEGVSLAEQVIDSGAAMDKLEQLVAWTKRQARSRRL